MVTIIDNIFKNIGGEKMKQILKKITVFIALVCILFGTNIQHVNAANPYLLGYKWDKRALSYYIDSTSSAPGVIPSDEYLFWETDIVYSFNMWDNIMGIYGINLTFTRTYNANQADILVKYAVSPSTANVVNNYSGTRLIKSTINIDDYEIYTNGISNESVKEIMLHEVGHTVGLKDISAGTAASQGFTSVMVNEMSSSYHAEFPTYDFDRYNILELYP